MHVPQHVRQPQHFPSVARRIREDATAKAEAEAALRLGLTIDEWDDLDDYQRAHALAPSLIDAEHEAKKCPACGDASGDCRDTDNQHAYVVTVTRCYRTRALLEAQRSPKWKNDPDSGSLLWHVALDPTRKKSAMKKEARRG